MAARSAAAMTRWINGGRVIRCGLVRLNFDVNWSTRVGQQACRVGERSGELSRPGRYGRGAEQGRLEMRDEGR